MTYSIIAKCSETGQYGVGIQSHFYAAGNACWANAGVGAVVTQAMALIDHGPLGLKLMAEGKSASEALSERLALDTDSEIRQVAMLDSKGRVAAHTGSVTIPAAGHVMGEGFSCQANLMWNDTVPQEMADAFEKSKGNLADRLLTALFAGQDAGGDIRGMQSGRILVVDSKIMDKEWEGILVYGNIDDHSEPLKEIERLLKVNSIYTDFTKNGYELELDKSQAITPLSAALPACNGLVIVPKFSLNPALKEAAIPIDLKVLSKLYFLIFEAAAADANVPHVAVE